MMVFKKAIPRRTVLRGLGATMALPFLAPYPAPGGASAAAREVPADGPWRDHLFLKRPAVFVFFRAYFLLLGARLAPALGVPRRRRNRPFQAGFEFRLAPDPPIRKGSFTLQRTPA